MPRGPVRVIVLTVLLVAVSLFIFGTSRGSSEENNFRYVLTSSEKWREGLRNEKWKLWSSNKPQRVPTTEERLQTNRPGVDQEPKDTMKIIQEEGGLDKNIALGGIQLNEADKTQRIKSGHRPAKETVHEPEMDSLTTAGHNLNHQLMEEEHNDMVDAGFDIVPSLEDEMTEQPATPGHNLNHQLMEEEHNEMLDATFDTALSSEKASSEKPLKQTQVPAKKYSTTLVLGKPGDVDAEWFVEKFPDWKTVMYDIPTSSSSASSSTKQIAQRGGSALAFLTYITENYKSLSEITLFVSILPLQKTLKNQLFDGEKDWKANLTTLAPALRTMNMTYLADRGYSSLRCEEKPGCSFDTIIKPSATWVFAQPWHHEIFSVWRSLFPTSDSVPQKISAPMVAQFSVTREQVHKRQLSEYQAMRTWIADSRTDEGALQRIMTALWHVVFSKDPVDCPAQLQCYCELYGKCKLAEDDKAKAAKAAASEAQAKETLDKASAAEAEEALTRELKGAMKDN